MNHAASTGQPGSVAIRRLSSKPYSSECFITPLSTVAKVATEMKDEYINAAGNDVTQAWLDYVRAAGGGVAEDGKVVVWQVGVQSKSYQTCKLIANMRLGLAY